MLRRQNPAAERQAERREREDNAPRLATAVPALESLRLELQERRAGLRHPDSTYARCIVVQHAPALFELPCHDPRCREGGYDVTYEIMQALHARRDRFEGELSCPGTMGSSNCDRVLHYSGLATYHPPAAR